MTTPTGTDVMVVYGTRPEAVKLGPLVRALRDHSTLRTSVWVTGQHAEMLAQVNTVFGIVPDGDLAILRPGQGLNRNLAAIVEGMDQVLARESPRAVLVQGDTTTVLGAALAAFHRGIAVVHLEAGLRTNDLRNPFPEEANRRLVSQIASLHLPPTSAARANLVREGIDAHTICVVGNTVVDAVEWTLKTIPGSDDDPITAWINGRPYVVVTTHRRESWDAGIARIAEALHELASRHPEIAWVVPMHGNPLIRGLLLPKLGQESNVLLSEPIEYAAFTRLMAGSACILTDSGGIQEEAPTLRVPALVLREVTERPEAIACGSCRLVGTDTNRVVDGVERILDDRASGAWVPPATSPFGDGHAAQRSVQAIAAFLADAPLPDDFFVGTTVSR